MPALPPTVTDKKRNLFQGRREVGADSGPVPTPTSLLPGMAVTFLLEPFSPSQSTAGSETWRRKMTHFCFPGDT